ncbi:basic proline-rich protein-like [Canis lupus familiaris]|uniref:basic proline-rich protein-like n=1 Tax=Canis lupus familiaris TaxID=9615 RepID=UPI0015F15BFA|nr:basic proline-rich protein-like [Canis lupus familiaris]
MSFPTAERAARGRDRGPTQERNERPPEIARLPGSQLPLPVPGVRVVPGARGASPPGCRARPQSSPRSQRLHRGLSSASAPPGSGVTTAPVLPRSCPCGGRLSPERRVRGYSSPGTKLCSLQEPGNHWEAQRARQAEPEALNPHHGGQPTPADPPSRRASHLRRPPITEGSPPPPTPHHGGQPTPADPPSRRASHLRRPPITEGSPPPPTPHHGGQPTPADPPSRRASHLRRPPITEGSPPPPTPHHGEHFTSADPPITEGSPPLRTPHHRGQPTPADPPSRRASHPR